MNVLRSKKHFFWKVKIKGEQASLSLKNVYTFVYKNIWKNTMHNQKLLVLSFKICDNI